MSDKKHTILQTALELFANEGYDATPTSKVAKKAGVSEGLIFRHFGSKQGLLDALLKEAEARLANIYGPILEEQHPKTAIRKIIEVPFIIKEEEYDFWRLRLMLKWRKEYDKPEKDRQLLDKLTMCFSLLRFGNPGREAEVLSYILETATREILKGKVHRSTPLRSFLFEKYGV